MIDNLNSGVAFGWFSSNSCSFLIDTHSSRLLRLMLQHVGSTKLKRYPHEHYLTSSILKLAYLGIEQTHKHHQLYTFIFIGSLELGPLTLLIEILFAIIILKITIIFLVQSVI